MFLLINFFLHIHSPCKIKRVDMQYNYVKMQHNYVDMRVQCKRYQM